MLLVHAQKLGKQYDHIGIHNLITTDFRIIIFTEKLLDNEVDMNIRLFMKNQVLILALLFTKGINEKTGNKPLRRQSG